MNTYKVKITETFEKIVSLINNFKKYYSDHNQVCYENPSPGNKAGGITTLEDKSLGCTQKAGLSKFATSGLLLFHFSMFSPF